MSFPGKGVCTFGSVPTQISFLGSRCRFHLIIGRADSLVAAIGPPHAPWRKCTGESHGGTRRRGSGPLCSGAPRVPRPPRPRPAVPTSALRRATRRGVVNYWGLLRRQSSPSGAASSGSFHIEHWTPVCALLRPPRQHGFCELEVLAETRIKRS